MAELRAGQIYSGQHIERNAVSPAPYPDQWELMEVPVILVVEDDWLLRQAMRDELEAAGWAVREAESGETALEILQGGAEISMLITDIRLGGTVDGWDVADAFREADPEIPVIYVSGNPALDTRRVANSAFLSKPCDMAKLLELCRALPNQAG